MDKMNKFLDLLAEVAEKFIPVVSYCSMLLLMYELLAKNESNRNKIFIILIILALMVELATLVYLRRRLNRQKSVAYKLEKWIEYDKKRKDIEEQMDVLSRELMDSDMSKYIDINRLIFDGQSRIPKSTIINYDSFLQQYGLDIDSVKVKKDSAVFLTPFNSEGDRLYRKCQQILSDVGIFLRRSDNVVEKDDILMNIIMLIVQSELVIVNIDGRNPNVYYELGIAHALGKSTILLSKRKGNLVDAGFDIRQKKIVLYETMDDLETKLLYQINLLNKSD